MPGNRASLSSLRGPLPGPPQLNPLAITLIALATALVLAVRADKAALGIIFGHWKRVAVLVDDFQVPDDPGYGYDDYGAGSALTLGYIKPAQLKFGLRSFFPSLSSDKETGARRGSVTLAADPVLVEILRKMPELREYPASKSSSALSSIHAPSLFSMTLRPRD